MSATSFGTSDHVAGYAVVTGGAAGIGFEFAKQLCEAGWQVAIADIDAQAAQQAVETLPNARPYRLDVSHADDWSTLAENLQSQWPRLDLLVNAAGVLLVGYHTDCAAAAVEKVLRINLLGTMLGCRSLAPWLEASHEPGIATTGIINLSSIFGSVSPPYFSAYAASKAGVTAFSESLRGELSPSGVNVTVAVPGIVKTNLFARSDYAKVSLRDRVSEFAGEAAISPDKVANQSLRAARQKKLYAVVGRRASRYWLLKRLFPQHVIDTVAKRVRAAFETK